MRASDQTTTDIPLCSPGGVANAAAQDSFCEGTSCVITVIYDQSSRNNHLTPAPPGGAASGAEVNGYDSPANATMAPVTLGGNKAYGVYITRGSGYRNDDTSGIATGDEPEGMYAVFDGRHYNRRCCFDYGNAETNDDDTGNGHMEAIYFGAGDGSGYGTGLGKGPWITAIWKTALFSGFQQTHDPGDPSIT
ncbi:hypothetical protein KC316_g305 [Hortaea werneckii]|nr:hypothetical protein KC324_g346 [Hortaea werneckii]KAI7595779.1 hypothetical protein KC316_g305 [Hortaea werneckii]